MEQKKRGLRIFLSGALSQVVTLLLGIIIPKLLIVSYGSETNGLLSSIKQIFVYVALLEAGIGTAALQAMYAPIATNDHQKASEIMVATDRYFKRTGRFYALAVIALAVLYPVVVKTELSPVTVAAIIILQGASGVIKYYFQGKLTILLRVDGRSYVTNNLLTTVSVLSHVAQIVLILCGFDIIAVQSAYFVINLLQMIYLTLYVKKHYQWLDWKAEPDYKALSQSKFVIIHQISGLIFNNTDILLLTYFCGLKTVSVYSLYNMIIGCVSNVIDTLCSSFEFILGQAFNSDRKRFMKLQEVYETYYLAFSFWAFTVTLIMLPSFIGIYTAGVTDANYMDKLLPYLFVAINILNYSRRTSSQIINFSGHFKQTQWRSVLESAINIVVSFVGVYYFGMYGVLLGTIAALLYRTNDIIIYANTKILFRSPWKTYRRWGVNIAVMLICVVGINQILPAITGWVQWILNAVWVSVVCMAAYIGIDSVCDMGSCKEAVSMIGNSSFIRRLKR